MAAWTPVRGDAIFIDGHNGRHLYVVLNEPYRVESYGGDVCLLVNISSRGSRFDDPTCLLAERSHPFVTRPSYVVYAMAEVKRSDDLIRKVAQGLYTLHPDSFNQAQVLRMLIGFERSRFTNFSMRELANALVDVHLDQP